MRFLRYFTFILLMAVLSLSMVQKSEAEEINQGDKVTIITSGVMTRLCPYPNCGQNQHITRIPKGTVLEIEGVTEVEFGRGKYATIVKWFEVTYKGKKGWVSIFDTDKVQQQK